MSIGDYDLPRIEKRYHPTEACPKCRAMTLLFSYQPATYHHAGGNDYCLPANMGVVCDTCSYRDIRKDPARPDRK